MKPTADSVVRTATLTHVCVCIASCLALAACGRPTPPDLRGEMTEAISRLGVRPIYPLSESHRIGAVHLVDASVARPRSGLPHWQEPSILLTEELVDSFEQARQRRASLTNRFPRSHEMLGNALRPGTTGQAFYRQVEASSTPKVPPGSLSLAAMPGFTLASVDQASVGGFLPGLAASFFGALGLRQTSYLRIEAEGVEMADLPHDEVRALVYGACKANADTQFGRKGQGAEGLVLAAYNILEQQQTEREAPANVEPYLALVRRVFYLRGVRFIVEDSRIAAAFLQASAESALRPGETPVSLPQLSASAELASAAGGTASAGAPTASTAANAAAMAALQQQLEQLRAALVNASGPQLGATFARAAATGIELVQLFDRPLAFGYQAVFVDARWDPSRPASAENLKGFVPLCNAI